MRSDLRKEASSMANEEQVKFLEQCIELGEEGIAIWNKWKGENPEIKINLRFVTLTDAYLRGIDFIEVDLRNADIWEANLLYANLENANLLRADLRGANLEGANLEEANLEEANLRDANLTSAVLEGANFKGAVFKGANFYGTDLRETNLEEANLRDTDVRGVDLSGTSLRRVDLRGADLRGADLRGADLWESKLKGAKFDGARTGGTNFNNVNLSEVVGLEKIKHDGPSSINIQTLILSKGQISEIFLRGCGVPEPFVENIPSLIGAIQSIHFYSCFISYSSQDQKFAQKLYRDLQIAGVRCWFAPEDMKWGAKIRPSIDQSIHIHEKLLLILSHHSLASQWVEQEVETALERERAEHRLILFPIRLDDEVMKIKTGWPLYLRNTRNIGDFTNQDTYQQSFHRLLRDLREEK